MLEEAIIALLLADAGVIALVSTRVYGGSRPQNAPVPSVVVNRISGMPVYTDDGETGLASARLQIDAWGGTYSSAKLTARAVIEALSAYNGTVSGVTFQNVLLEDERDSMEGGKDDPEYPFSTSLDFTMWYEN